MKFRPWYRAWPETAALLFGLAWIPLLPRRAVVALSRAVGAIGFRHAHKLRGVAMENLDVAFGDDMTAEAKRDLTRQCFQHFALVVLDIIWFAFFCQKRLRKWVRWDESARVILEDEGQLILTAHYGNWEILGQSIADHGQPIFSVAAPLKNRPADRIFIHLRQKTGQVIIPQKGAARRLLQGLRKRKKVGVLLDQNTKPRDGGVFVNFMGLPVPVSSAPAALAVKTRATICTVMAVPDERGRYTVTVHDTFQPDPESDDPIHALTQRMTDSVVKVIREHPRYWCWMYTRWQLIPDGNDPARYPSYARPLEPRDIKLPKPDKDNT